MSDPTIPVSLSDLTGSLGAIELALRWACSYSALLKVTVGLVWFLELGHTISAWHAVRHIPSTRIGTPPPSEEITILFAALIYTIVQIFFANRVRVLSGRWYIMALACMLGLLRFAGHMSIAALLLKYSRISILLQLRWLVSASLSLDLTVDVLITISLCYCLWNLRRCESKRTRTIVDTLILWTIESTILTSAASIIQIVLFLTRTDLVWTGVFVIQAKLFSNAMLASEFRLNGRLRFRDNANEISDSIIFAPRVHKEKVVPSFEGARSQSSVDSYL
ncbi:hypothetical protein B0H17DRAFT_1208119 [Mycena rosella]|uniref:DUF6534 domain-containing protein n=1 Tax=Mycena rosella TaxID=1033263 RepID=A0AAD7D2X3_MYCRO|nr:hypothetical protein B0H17DRAFT_1208119 [Mycena rosella]